MAYKRTQEQLVIEAFRYMIANGEAVRTKWEMDDMLELTKPISDSYWNAKFRLWVFIPNRYGMQIKVEAFIIHVCEWETMFEGYIEDISDIRRILGMQLGLPLKERMQELINDMEF